jgi:hypothetical protein
MDHLLGIPDTRMRNKFTNTDPSERVIWDNLECDGKTILRQVQAKGPPFLHLFSVIIPHIVCSTCSEPGPLFVKEKVKGKVVPVL